ncbi:MAG: response regulator transcription factor [Flavobacteriales bacterium]|nr:response regulator transcription factor [Flavobacteriales bacterium]
MSISLINNGEKLGEFKTFWEEEIKKIQEQEVFEVRPGETYESHLMGGQFQFCVKLKSYLVFHIRGLQEVLGYENKEFDLDFIFFSDLIHPDHKFHFFSFYKTIFKIHMIPQFTGYENISFSFKVMLKHKDGRYLKFFAQSVATMVAEDGGYAGGFFNLMNVDGMADSYNFGWDISGEKEVVKAFKGRMKKEMSSLLTKRESDVLRYLKDGYSSKMIAQELGIAKNTVDNYRSQMLKKTSTGNTAQLISMAQKNGWI